MYVSCHTTYMDDNYPLASSAATRMLAQGLARAKDEQGLSVRQIGKIMNYKTAVVLSHMATGRVPIPIDRASELANILKLDERSFLFAVLHQRHPDVDWADIFRGEQSEGNDGLAMELEVILGGKLKDLSREHRGVMREVASERSPRRRWLSVHELPVVMMLRELLPALSTEGLDQSQIDRMRSALRER